MALSLQEELRKTFDRAALRKEAASLRSPRQWRKANEIQDRCRQAVQKEEKLYRERFDLRVELARRRIINEAARKNLDLDHPLAFRDRFHPADTLRQAQRTVRAAHERRINTINDYEVRELRSLMLQSMRENNLRGKPREAFLQATNRRFGEERRGRSRA